MFDDTQTSWATLTAGVFDDQTDIIIIMYIYHALINALNAHMIHINLNVIFYTHVEHSPTKTIYIKYYAFMVVKRRFTTEAPLCLALKVWSGSQEWSRATGHWRNSDCCLDVSGTVADWQLTPRYLGHPLPGPCSPSLHARCSRGQRFTRCSIPWPVRGGLCVQRLWLTPVLT